MERVLSGIRVVDLSHVLAAPFASMMLADLGAEVIHVEPPDGDDAREYSPYIGKVDKNTSGYFISLNRNKKSIVLNLRHEKGKQILRELIKISDVLIENFRNTTMESLGFSWQEIQRLNPRTIYASVSGFGHNTLPEYASKPAYDMVVQAYSGLMSITGPEGGEPCRVGNSIGDIIAGHQAVVGILAALLYRQKSGRGQHYDGAMVDGLFATLENAVVRYTATGEIPEPLGTASPSITPFQAFPTKDNWIVIAIGNQKLWTQFCRVLGAPQLTDDPRFTANPQRNKNRKALAEAISVWTKTKTTAEWSAIFDKESLPYSPVNNMKEICEDPHIKERKMLVEVDQPGVGKIRIAGSPIHLSETPGEVYSPAPRLGEHTEEVLKSLLNLTDAEIEALRKEEVIN
jgi:CoA:oxalate CoA-transferase